MSYWPLSVWVVFVIAYGIPLIILFVLKKEIETEIKMRRAFQFLVFKILHSALHVSIGVVGLVFVIDHFSPLGIWWFIYSFSQYLFFIVFNLLIFGKTKKLPKS